MCPTGWNRNHAGKSHRLAPVLKYVTPGPPTTVPRRVGTVVAAKFAAAGPLFRFYVCGVLLVAGPGPGDGDLVFLAVPVKLVVDEVAAVVESKRTMGKGNIAVVCWIVSDTHF